MKKTKHIIEYLIVITLRPVLSSIPYRIRLPIGKIFGIGLYYLYKKRRDISLDNISNSFPEKNNEWHKKLCKYSFMHLSMSIMEFMQIPVLNKKFINKYFIIEGEKYLKEALKKGKGLIAICPHIGNWEYVAAYFGLKGYPASVIMKRQSNPYINRIIEKYRKSLNIELIYKRKAGFAVLRALKQNRIIGFVADQDAGKNGIFVDFLGRMASTAQGPARFALSYGTPVIVIIGIRKGNGVFKIIASPILDFKYNKKIREEAIMENTLIWTKKTEDYIKKYPEQYFWIHRRWKTKNDKTRINIAQK